MRGSLEFTMDNDKKIIPSCWVCGIWTCLVRHLTKEEAFPYSRV